jgi:hypothetical protein
MILHEAGQMRNRGYGGRKNIQKKCPCGSGRKQKNCHPLPGAAKEAAQADKQELPANPAVPIVTSRSSPWGMPGEEHKIWTAFVRKSDHPDPRKVNLSGTRGRYKVQFLLSRPGFPITAEREHRFIDGVVGESHIRIVKPLAEQGPNDNHELVIETMGKRFIGSASDAGLLGSFITEFDCESFQAAETEAYGALAPLLSVWSINADVPLSVETIQVTEVATQISSLRARTPHFEMNFGTGAPIFSDEFSQYASIYREGLNTNSSFYRYLCFFKIVESIIARRARQAGERRKAGNDPHTIYERIPKTKEEQLALLRCLYVWRNNWDDMAIDQIFLPEILGRKITAILKDHLRPLRLGIAHGLLEQGEITMVLDKIENIQAVNKWLPACRICARWMLLNEFPRECAGGMKPGR